MVHNGPGGPENAKWIYCNGLMLIYQQAINNIWYWCSLPRDVGQYDVYRLLLLLFVVAVGTKLGDCRIPSASARRPVDSLCDALACGWRCSRTVSSISSHERTSSRLVDRSLADNINLNITVMNGEL
jgi:hypothetical protein